MTPEIADTTIVIARSRLRSDAGTAFARATFECLIDAQLANLAASMHRENRASARRQRGTARHADELERQAGQLREEG
jgi:hypothetical protein